MKQEGLLLETKSFLLEKRIQITTAVSSHEKNNDTWPAPGGKFCSGCFFLSTAGNDHRASRGRDSLENRQVTWLQEEMLPANRRRGSSRFPANTLVVSRETRFSQGWLKQLRPNSTASWVTFTGD